MTPTLLAILIALSVAPSKAVLMNQVQVIGTHNSYHAGLTAPRRPSCTPEIRRRRTPSTTAIPR